MKKLTIDTLTEAAMSNMVVITTPSEEICVPVDAATVLNGEYRGATVFIGTDKVTGIITTSGTGLRFYKPKTSINILMPIAVLKEAKPAVDVLVDIEARAIIEEAKAEAARIKKEAAEKAFVAAREAKLEAAKAEAAVLESNLQVIGPEPVYLDGAAWELRFALNKKKSYCAITGAFYEYIKAGHLNYDLTLDAIKRIKEQHDSPRCHDRFIDTYYAIIEMAVLLSQDDFDDNKTLARLLASLIAKTDISGLYDRSYNKSLNGGKENAIKAQVDDLKEQIAASSNAVIENATIQANRIIETAKAEGKRIVAAAHANAKQIANEAVEDTKVSDALRDDIKPMLDEKSVANMNELRTLRHKISDNLYTYPGCVGGPFVPRMVFDCNRRLPLGVNTDTSVYTLIYAFCGDMVEQYVSGTSEVLAELLAYTDVYGQYSSIVEADAANSIIRRLREAYRSNYYTDAINAFVGDKA